MKLIKKLFVTSVLTVVLLGNCLTVAAASACSHSTTTTYSKTLLYSEYGFYHTEQLGTTSVGCDVYYDYYNVGTYCSTCDKVTYSTVKEDRHVYR